MNKNLAFQLEQRLPSESLDLIRAAGEIATDLEMGLYLVGGAVRDILLGKANFDLDLVVEGDAPKLAGLLAQRKGGEVVVHHRFGTANFHYNNLRIDFATARAETYQHPGALPTVHPGSIKKDLLRRDFTVNAMAIHLSHDNFGELFDPYQGEDDLAHNLIRILHEKSFIDDATRMLRAVRYEQRFDFQIEPTTEALLRRDLAMLNTISGDRIRHELELIFREEYPEKPLRRAGELGLLKEIHPLLKGGGWLKDKLKQARSTTYPVSLALSFSLLVYHFSQEEGERFISRLRMPGGIARTMRDTLHLRENLSSLAAPELLPSAIYRFLQDYSPSSILVCAIASESASIRERLHLYLNKLRYVKTSLDGEVLQQMGVLPGPRIGEILRDLHEARLDQRVRTREEEKELVHHLRDDSPIIPRRHHRRSLRLKGYDYSQHGAYFVTLCTSKKGSFFENPDIKQIAERRWMWLEEQYDYVEIDEWVVMPNHLHAIVIIGSSRRGDSRIAPTKRKPLGRLIGAFKTTSTKLIHQLGYPHFAWQRNYYEHIIRNEKELTRLREYIRTNPLKWQFDKENPDHVFALDYRKQWEWLEGKEDRNR